MAKKATPTKVIVVGGGVIGATTAWALADRGHSVTLFERETQIATQASASNAGLVVPGDSLVWATPSAIPTLIKAGLKGAKSFIRVRLSAGWWLIPWGARFMVECLPSRMRRNVISAHRLSVYSFAELKRLQDQLQLDFFYGCDGMSFLADGPQGAGHLAEERKILAGQGEEYRTYTPKGFVAVDPGFELAAKDVGGVLYTPGAASGDSARFAREMTTRAVELGVKVRSGTDIARILMRSDKVIGVESRNGEVIESDVVVLAAGAATRNLARTVGVKLSIVPVKGYAVTVPILDTSKVPEVGGVDERSHVAYSRMGDRLRMSGTAEFAGYDQSQDPKDFVGIRETGESLFPGVLDWEHAEYHWGWRPATPDGNPIIGWSNRKGLVINSGHGSLGWTHAAGSSQIVADLISGLKPAIDIEQYQVR